MALAFVEALIMEDAHKAQAIARATTEADLDDMFFTASKCLCRDGEVITAASPPVSRRSTNGDRPAGDGVEGAVTEERHPWRPVGPRAGCGGRGAGRQRPEVLDPAVEPQGPVGR